MRGRLIVVEGLDGVGKTTLSRGIADALGAVWRTTPSPDLRAHRAPFDAAYREIPAASQLFYAASVVAAGQATEADLAAGRDVVFDRYWCTTRAYARAAGSVLRLDEVEAILPCADVTLLVELSEDERWRRVEARGASDLDRASFEPARRRALRDALREAVARPVAGVSRILDVSNLDPGQALRAALVTIAGTGREPATDGAPAEFRWAG
jgi:dTMP kinase